MNAKLLKFFRDVRNSYWFVPSLMMVGALVLAVVTNYLDTMVKTSEIFVKFPWLYESHPAGARAVLSAIATSMIGVAGVTFSMTIVSVSFAAAQYGPRLINNFMRDPGNQITLGTFIATFVYCLLVLRTITEGSPDGDSAHVPHISVFVSLCLTLASVSVLIYFIHHIPESINVSRITAQIGKELEQSIQNIYPKNANASIEHHTDTTAFEPFDKAVFDAAYALKSGSCGYIQAVDTGQLVTLATQHDLTLRLEYRPGDFVLTDSTFLYALPKASITEEVAQCLNECFVVGTRRTGAQNTLFVVDQLVEIMARALSPGINDPFTALSCMDWLTSALAKAIQSEHSSPHSTDDKGVVRLIVHSVSMQDLASATFDQSRQYVATDRIAALHMMRMIAELVAIASKPEFVITLLEYADKLNAAGQDNLTDMDAREALALRHAQTHRIANDPAYKLTLRDQQGWLGGSA